MADRPVFIGGLMKSGTSLLRVLLGQHPNLYATFESHWFDPAIRDEWENPDSRRMTFLRRFLEIADTCYAGLVETKRQTPDREFIDIVYAAMVQCAGKARWIDKTPDNVLHRDEIAAIWPDATLIHVTREPRDCFASWKDKRGDTLDIFLAAAGRVWDGTADVLGCAPQPGYLEVDYNALVSQPAEVMAPLLDALGEPWDHRVATLDTDAMVGERETVKAVTGRDSHTNRSLVRPIFTDSVGQWRRILTEDEAKTIRTELSSFYDRLGDRWEASC